MGAPLDARQVDRVRRTLLAGTQDFAPAWLDDGRVAVALEEQLDLDPGFVERLAAAIRADGGVAWGVTCESWPGYREPDGQVISADPAEIVGFFDDTLPVDMIITTPSLQFAVLFGQDEYSLIGGPQPFVETVLGMTLAEARAQFRAYAAEMADAARHLPEVAARYAP